jgi:lipoprotein-releasing system permease protein
MIQVFVLVSVVLGIASVLAITVMQKSKQVGILKAMGITDRISSLVFLFQGLFLGLLGAVLGVLLGVGLCVMFVTFARNPDGTALIAISVDYGFIALSAGIAVLAAIVASLIPARKSSQLNPIEVIRNG